MKKRTLLTLLCSVLLLTASCSLSSDGVSVEARVPGTATVKLMDYRGKFSFSFDASDTEESALWWTSDLESGKVEVSYSTGLFSRSGLFTAGPGKSSGRDGYREGGRVRITVRCTEPTTGTFSVSTEPMI